MNFKLMFGVLLIFGIDIGMAYMWSRMWNITFDRAILLIVLLEACWIRMGQTL